MAAPNYPTTTVTGSQIGTLNLTMDAGNAPNLRPQQYYDRMLLEILRQKDFIHNRFAQTRSLPKNAGTNTINFRKLGKLAPATTPLTEGITPAGQTAQKYSITATVAQYGNWMAFSDKVDFEEIDPVIEEYTKEMGFNAKETLDVLVRDILANGTMVRYAQYYGADGKTEPATPVTTRAGLKPANDATAPNRFSLREVRKAVRDFRKNLVRPVYNGNYVCFISPDTEFDIMDDAWFQKMMQYGMDNKPMLDNEIGTIANVTFFRTPNAKVFAGAGSGGCDVHAAILIGANAYGIVNVTGEGDAKMIIKGKGSAGTEDPLDQRQSIGWKVNAFGAVRLEELAICRIEHTVSV